MQILVVDDVSVMRDLLSAVAATAFPDARIETAADLATGLACARGMAPLDLVLLDLGLPGCRGIDALLVFREAFPDAKIVVVSSHDAPDLIAAARAAGATDFLSKRTKAQDMVAALRAAA